MLHALIIITLLFISGYLVLLIRSFEYMSVSELKRQARGGNVRAAKIYKVRGVYGAQLWILLWGLLGYSMSAVILLLDVLVWSWVALIINVPLIVLIHAILPWSKWPEPNLKLAASASPFIEQALYYLRPVFGLFSSLLNKWFEPEAIGRVHSKEELLEILQHTEMVDAVSRDELKIAASALTFGDQRITDVMTPIGVVKTVNVGDVLSPIVLDELHEVGFSRFPVKGEGGSFVGTLYFKDAVNMKSDSRAVKDVMRKDVYYVNEAAMLDSALKAFLKTQHHLFLVVNEFEDVTGVISIEDVLERIIGSKIIDEFDQYDDLRAVAKQLAEKRAENNNHVAD